jgi:putrescine aminotransferase
MIEVSAQPAVELSAQPALADAARHMVPGIVKRQRVIAGGAHEVSGDGAVVHLSNGRTVLDFGSYAVTLFGHRPAAVLAMVRTALDQMPATTRLLPNPYAMRFAQQLAMTIAPGSLPRVCLGLNGSDAVETAMKLAIARTGRSAILAVDGAFHGKSIGALATTADADRRSPLRGFLGDVRHIPWRPEAVDEAARERPFAALIFEPVQGEGGGRAIPPRLLRRWTRDAHAAGAYVIADEIQCGLRRCGPVSVAEYEQLGVDAVLLGKALGGGVLPLSAVVCSDDLFQPLIDDPYFHTATFGGHPASCAAGLAALDLLEELDERFGEASRDLAVMIDALRGLGPVVRSEAIGLFGVLEFATPAAAAMAVLQAGRRGLLMAPCLSAPCVVRLLPPVVTTPGQFADATAKLAAVCQRLG